MNGQALQDFFGTVAETFRLDLLGSQLLIPCGGATSVTIQADIVDGAWGSAELTVERSNTGSGTEWYALSTPVTISSSGIYTITPDTAFLRVYVTTAGSANDRVRVTAYYRLS